MPLTNKTVFMLGSWEDNGTGMLAIIQCRMSSLPVANVKHKD
jgi:hypothetical protein